MYPEKQNTDESQANISSSVCEGAARVKINTVDNGQNELMIYGPQTGRLVVIPVQAARYREIHGSAEWLFNPWTGQRRSNADISNDRQGLLIHV